MARCSNDADMAQIRELVGFPLKAHAYPALGDKVILSPRALLKVDGITASWGTQLARGEVLAILLAHNLRG